MKVKISKIKKASAFKVPIGVMHSDWFKCTVCGHTEMKRVLGDYGTCARCGGRMERIK